MDKNENLKEELDKELNRELEESYTQKPYEIKKVKDKNSVISMVVVVACLLIALGLLYVCGSSILSFFSEDKLNTSTISNNSANYDGDYLAETNYSAELLNEEVYYLNGVIPISIMEWEIKNNGDSIGYPAAYLIATQFDGDREIILQDAENMLIDYDADGSSWEDKFVGRYSNIDPGKSNKFYTAFVLYDASSEVTTEWVDLSGI